MVCNMNNWNTWVYWTGTQPKVADVWQIDSCSDAGKLSFPHCPRDSHDAESDALAALAFDLRRR